MNLKELLEAARLQAKEAALDDYKAQEGEPTKVPQTLSPEVVVVGALGGAGIGAILPYMKVHNASAEKITSAKTSYKVCGSEVSCAICGRDSRPDTGMPIKKLVRAGTPCPFGVMPANYGTMYAHEACVKSFREYRKGGLYFLSEEKPELVSPTPAEVVEFGGLLNKLITLMATNGYSDLGSKISCAVCRNTPEPNNPIYNWPYSHSGCAIANDGTDIFAHSACYDMLLGVAKVDYRQKPDYRHLLEVRDKFSVSYYAGEKAKAALEPKPTKTVSSQWVEILGKAQAHKEQQQASKADLFNQFMDHLAAGASPAKLNAMLTELGPDGFEVLQTLIGKAALGHGVKPSEEKGEVLPPAPKRRVLG